ncbi:MAG: hypothetical protein DHS20C13_28570 [Thermodesulfobacteriota bacterium]|nr:MAG: hypothetical protein DHS20C13_28570 [Thermodesulfobacteriota bacterium]
MTACVAIDNCAVNAVNMVNGCGECSAEHAWGYSNKTGVDYTKCISVTDTNCEVHDGETCHFCKLGHTLNYDN